ncbi:RluA family pseudouridine synthase [Patescibacteria group bacterium]|nr:RluA family pseudouridine synthase [Patescibacteria group bacterium]
MLNILYEDNHLIAVFKPVGVLVQADKGGEKCLMDEIKDYLKKKYNKTGNVFLGLLHRLDRPVAGIVLFAKTSKGASRLSEQFRDHKVNKIYHALVIGKPKKSRGILINYLIKNEQKNKVKVFDKEVSGSQRAELEYEVIKTNDKNSILKIILKTGRSHQIRSQLAHLDCPIVGDIKYGAPEPLPDKSIALVATEISFRTATGDDLKTIKIDIPFNI